MSIKEIADQFIKAEINAFLKNDFTALVEIEDPNVVIHISPLGDFKGHEAQKQYILGASKAVTDLKLELKYLAGDGNLFLLNYKSSGKIASNMPGFPPAIGKKLSNDYLFAVQINNGKIVEIWANGSSSVND